MYYDAHTHLNSPELYLNVEKYIQNFVDIWWKSMIIVWASQEYNNNAIILAKKFNLKITLWLHPEILNNNDDIKTISSKMKELKELIIQNKNSIVAVGECGIDLYFPWTEQTLNLQKELFAMQCNLAQQLDLPLVVHSRTAFDYSIDILKNYKNLTIYFHCRGYGPEQIKILQSSFPKLYIWFCGNVTYKKADELRESLKLVWSEQLLLETDAPYLSPQIVRWTQNEPANVRYIYDYVAELLWKEKNVLQVQIEKNFKNIYKL
jgi:TatD DNase family protein